MDEKLDLLNELSSGEDEFDVDLMACGCRVAPGAGNDMLTIRQWVTQIGMGRGHVSRLLDRVVTQTRYSGRHRRGDVRGYEEMEMEALCEALDEVTLETNFDAAELQKLAKEIHGAG